MWDDRILFRGLIAAAAKLLVELWYFPIPRLHYLCDLYLFWGNVWFTYNNLWVCRFSNFLPAPYAIMKWLPRLAPEGDDADVGDTACVGGGSAVPGPAA